MRQNFKPKSKNANSKNNILLDLRLKYQKVAEDSESKGIEWIPAQWKHFFSGMKKQNVIKQDFKNKPVSQMIDFLIEKF